MIAIFIIILTSSCILNISYQYDCDLDSASPTEQALLNRLSVLKGKNYKINDTEYNYYFAVCAVPTNATNQNDPAGLLQERLDNKQQYVIGRLTDVDLEGSENLIRVTYRNGDPYGNVCNRTSRNAVVFVICNYQKDGEFSILEENHHREVGCAYVFQLETSAICPNSSRNLGNKPTVDSHKSNKHSDHIGAFSIILIILGSILIIYVVFGVLYMRFVRQARGWHQIPNFKFWNRIGNFQADICDYICRCNGAGNETNAQPYESLSGELSDDENILNL